jgi:hypothetical protein
MANNLNGDNLHTVFAMCGNTDQATRALSMAHKEGFTQLEDLCVLETEMDITEISKEDGILHPG